MKWNGPSNNKSSYFQEMTTQKHGDWTATPGTGKESWRSKNNCCIHRLGFRALHFLLPAWARTPHSVSSFPLHLHVPHLVVSCHDDAEENHVQNRNKICHRFHLFRIEMSCLTTGRLLPALIKDLSVCPHKRENKCVFYPSVNKRDSAPARHSRVAGPSSWLWAGCCSWGEKVKMIDSTS